MRRGARDVAEDDPDPVIRRDPIPQSRRPDGLSQCRFQRAGGVRQTRDELRLDNRCVPRIRQIDPQAGFSVRKFDAHLSPKDVLVEIGHRPIADPLVDAV